MDIWQLELEPVYRRTAPYAQKFFTQGRQFAVETALPQAQYAGSAAWTFWVRQIWPKLAVLYGENVEPQLMRITERLGRYRDEKQLEADVKSVESSSTLEAKSSSIASSVSSAYLRAGATVSCRLTHGVTVKMKQVPFRKRSSSTKRQLGLIHVRNRETRCDTASSLEVMVVHGFAGTRCTGTSFCGLSDSARTS